MSSPTSHTLLSPSSSHRWLKCTPSALLESYEPGESSVYAQEGTEAHALAELKLRYKYKYISQQQYETEFNSFVNNSEYYNSEFEECVDMYVNEVSKIFENSIYNKIVLEEKVYFEDIVPNGSGTSDCILIGNDTIHIIDLKFGKGVKVLAEDNPQLRLYALGAVSNYIRECNCKIVKMTIIQPRLDWVQTVEMKIEELNDWAINYVKPRALLAQEGKGDLVPGEHCKFCKLRGKCKALSTFELDKVKEEFNDVIIEERTEPANMKPIEIAKVLTVAPTFIAWFESVKKYALDAAINGKIDIPGYKIVEGKSNRILTSHDEIIKKLKEAGFDESSYLKPAELLGITALEKNIGKTLFNEICGDYIVKPAGKPTLVEITDVRPALTTNTFNGNEFND